jgi:DNA-binding Lrp family transcriptional regulator
LQLLKKNYNQKRWPIRGKEILFTQEEQDLINKTNLSREFNRFQMDHIIQEFTLIPNNQYLVHLLSGGERPHIPNDFSTKFYLQIQPKKLSQYTSLAKQLVHDPHIIDLYRTGNEAGLLSVVRTSGLKGLNTFLKSLYERYDIMDTHTTVVVEETLPTIYPPSLKIAKEICKSR